ncbi:MAG: prephenate dehydrogenase/arogenate dehydrogenase family protein [Clostridiales bacterium]|nr:prephenate dehydrogenase/arogenate dehydrogenase family protein [Clostridiales bacterium]
MTVGIVGLGLIGGSMAKAYKQAGHRVLAMDRDPSVTAFAQMAGAADGELTMENLPSCELLLLAVYPAAAVRYLEENAPYLSKTAAVIDCCGIKREVCRAGFRLAEQRGFLFVGGHPMAGTHFSGFKYSRATLFQGAPMVLVPPVLDDMQMIDRVRKLLEAPKFGSFSVTTAEKHDEMIAFTSQLAHVVSNAYIKSPTAGLHKGFSAGSYKDLTRVAWLNAPMWTELFLDNRDCLIQEINGLTAELQKYRDALEAGDRDSLCALLEEGKRRKEEVG